MRSFCNVKTDVRGTDVRGTVSVKTNLEKSTGKKLPLLTEKETKDRIKTAVIDGAVSKGRFS